MTDFKLKDGIIKHANVFIQAKRDPAATIKKSTTTPAVKKETVAQSPSKKEDKGILQLIENIFLRFFLPYFLFLLSPSQS